MKQNLTLSHYWINLNQLNRSLFPFLEITLKNENRNTKEHLETLPVTINFILLLIMTYCRTRAKMTFCGNEKAASSFQFFDFTPFLYLSVSFYFFLFLSLLCFPESLLDFKFTQAPNIMRDRETAKDCSEGSSRRLGTVCITMLVQQWALELWLFFGIPLLQFSSSSPQIQVLWWLPEVCLEGEDFNSVRCPGKTAWAVRNFKHIQRPVPWCVSFVGRREERRLSKDLDRQRW